MRFLSDHRGTFQQIDIFSLQRVNGRGASVEYDEPSFDDGEFKPLYGKGEAVEDESDGFVPLYRFDEENNQETEGQDISGLQQQEGEDDLPEDAEFQPLTGGTADAAETEGEMPKEEKGEGPPVAQPIDSKRDDGYEKGFEAGRAAGREQGKAEGYTEGFEKGEKEAEQRVNENAADMLSTLDAALNKVDSCYTSLVEQYESEIISLVCRIAEKVVLAKVEIEDDIVRETVLDALKTIPEPEDITLYVSSEDYEYIEMIRDDFFENIKSLKSVSVKSDDSVDRGGCRIETSKAGVETSPRAKLDRIFSAITTGKTV